jgi:hypothetical protein
MHMLFLEEEDHNFEVYVEVCQGEVFKKTSITTMFTNQVTLLQNAWLSLILQHNLMQEDVNFTILHMLMQCKILM